MSEVAYLPNVGTYGNTYQFEKNRRLAFQLIYKEDGSKNKLTPSSGQVTLATLQALFNKQRYESDVKEKIVVLPVIYNYIPTQADPQVYDNGDGYTKKTKEGDLTATFVIEEPHPDIVYQLKEMENIEMGVYQIDDESRIGGKVTDATDLYPIQCSVEVKSWKNPDKDAPGQSIVTVRFKNPLDMNSFDFAQIIDSNGDNAEVFDDSQFYSLTDCTLTVATPAVTGCIVTVENKRLSTVGNSSKITGLTYEHFQFRNQSDNSTIQLAGAGSISESSGVYTINEAAILTSGVSYYIELIADEYDAVRAAVVVP